MNKKSFLATLFSLFTLFACNQPIDDFDAQGDNFIYFDMPNVLNQLGHPTKVRDTVMSYSFDMDESHVTFHTFKIPVTIIGIPSATDRKYHVEVVADKSTATAEDWDKTTISNLTVKSGEMRDTIYLKVNRTEILQKEERRLVLRIVPNEHFLSGYNNLLEISILFTDHLTPPEWWEKWQSIFGEFSREKFTKWKEIYYLGADPNVERFEGQYALLYDSFVVSVN